MKLYKHQKRFLKKNPDKTLLCWDTGTGKTRTAIEYAKQNFATQIIAVCPKALKENWMREIIKYQGNYLNPWRIYSKEEFRRDWETTPKAEVLIIDEAHYFSGMKSQMSKSLRKYIKKHNIKYILLMTATPYMSTPWNIYVLARHLGHDWSYMKFRDKFFQDRYIGRRVVPEVKPGMQDEVAKLVARIGDVVRLDECADVPDQVFETELFQLTAQQDKAAKTLMETNPVVRYTKYHQIENGTLKGDEFTENSFFPSNKLERIKDIVEEHKKVAIICRYNLQIDLYEKELNFKGNIFVIRGSVKDRDSVVQEIERSDSCIVLINAACSEGYELPSIGMIVFASMSFSYKDYKQMLGRFLRINALKKNVYLHLVTDEGVDVAVYGSIMKKQNFDVAIYSQLNTKGSAKLSR